MAQHAVRGGRDVADTAVPMNGISAVQNGVFLGKNFLA